jgi:hypothetical protein
VICYRNSHDERVLRGEHTDACSGAGPDWHPPLTWIDCDGCAPCTKRHCRSCDREHLDNDHPRTCPRCVGRVRTRLQRLVDLSVLAQTRLRNWWPSVSPGAPRNGAGSNETPLPGGDLLVLTGPGSRAINNPRPDLDEHVEDPLAVTTELAIYADDWWAEQHPDQHLERTLPPTLTWVVRYLGEHLTWAAQRYPLFEEFTQVISVLVGRLEAELRDEVHVLRGVPCLECGVTLERRARALQPCRHQRLPQRRTVRDFQGYSRKLGYCLERLESWPEYDARVTAWFVDHLNCDQGGLAPKWTCPGCGQKYDDRQYRNAVAMGNHAFAPSRPAVELAEQYGIRPGTIRQLANRGQVRKYGFDDLGRRMYDVEDVRAIAEQKRAEETA